MVTLVILAQEVVAPAAGTAAVWIALIGTGGTLATVVITHLLTARKQNEIVHTQERAEVKQDEAAVEQSVQAGAIQEVHTLTNDRLERMDAALKKMESAAEKDRAEIAALKRLLASERKKPKAKR